MVKTTNEIYENTNNYQNEMNKTVQYMKVETESIRKYKLSENWK